MLKLFSKLIPSISIPTVLTALGSIAIILSLLGGLYYQGIVAGQHKVELADLKAKLAYTQLRLKINQDVAKADELQAINDDEVMASLNKQIEELNAQLQAPNTECFGAADTDRLRKLWPQAKPRNH
jgi:hypothetical protein